MASRKAGYAALQLDDEPVAPAELDVDVLRRDRVTSERQHPWDKLGVHRSHWRRLSPVYVMWWYALPLLKTHLQTQFNFEHLWGLPAGSSAEELLQRYLLLSMYMASAHTHFTYTFNEQVQRRTARPSR